MNPLWIFFNSANKVNLSGEDGGETVITGCRYAPGKGIVSPTGDTITEVLDLVLQGNWANICNKVYAIEEYLEVAKREVVKKDYVYLRFYTASPAYDWRSRILSGRLELGAKGLVDRDNESQHVILTIVRQNYWFKPRCYAPVFDYTQIEPNLNSGPIGIYGCDLRGTTPGVINHFGLCGHLSDGDMPGPVDLEIGDPDTGTALGSVTISSRVLVGAGRADFLSLESSDLVQGADATLAYTAAADCSFGTMARITWTLATEAQLCTVTYLPSELDVLRGQVQRGVVRLANTIAYTDLWVCLKAFYPGTSTVLAESLWLLVPAGTKYFELPPLALVPGLGGSLAYGGVTLGLYARRASAGTYTLDIDSIQFSQANSMRRLTDLSGGVLCGHNGYLVDSGILEGCYYQISGGTKATTHFGTGPFLNVIPGYDVMVRIDIRPEGDATWTITGKSDVKVYYEPRRRNL